MRAPDLREPLKRASACARYQKAAGPQRGASHTAGTAHAAASASGQPPRRRQGDRIEAPPPPAHGRSAAHRA